VFTSASPRCLDGGDVDLFIVIIASKARFASSPPAASASVSARGVDLPGEAPGSLHQPHALSVPPLPTIAIPVTVRLFLDGPSRSERKKPRCAERQAAVRPRQGMPRTVNSTVSTSPSCRSDNHREPREPRLLYYPERWRRRSAPPHARLVEPEADRVLWLHVRVLLVLDQGERRWS